LPKRKVPGVKGRLKSRKGDIVPGDEASGEDDTQKLGGKERKKINR